MAVDTRDAPHNRESRPKHGFNVYTNMIQNHYKRSF